MKKIFYFILAISLFLCLFSSCDIDSDSTNADDSPENNLDCFKFELNEDQLSYTLTEYNYFKDNSPETVEIPSTYENLPVTKIEERAFYACQKIETLTISEGITRIGAQAFFHCDKISILNFPASVSYIGEYAFEGCDSLTSIQLPGAANIGFRAFYECENLTSFTMGDCEDLSVTVDGYAFYKCKKLKNIDLGNCVTEIGERAFSDCEQLDTVYVSNSLKEIKGSAFEGCTNLTLITFNGTTSEWLAIKFWPWWMKDTGDFDVDYLQD